MKNTQLIKSLLNADAYPIHATTPTVELIETHISWVFLVGDYAYKIKKPIRLGFLDFSTLKLRERYCHEELRINRRYSPELYLSVVPIAGHPEMPLVEGAGKVIEYAVKMRRFPPSSLFDQLLLNHQLLPLHVLRLAEILARFHLGLPHDSPENQRVRFNQGKHNIEANFSAIRPNLSDPDDVEQLEIIRNWTGREFDRHQALLVNRIAEGHIRECHGDLHLGNIVWIDNQPKLFDGIEFRADLRWIDTVNEIAFPVMDLEIQGERHLAFHFLNRYLELSGDYAAVALLNYYRMYRAMVRGKVAILRCQQIHTAQEKSNWLHGYRRYSAYGLTLTQQHTPSLIITNGISGSGKSSIAAQVAAQLPAICIRSDIERKRLFIKPLTNESSSTLGGGLYGQQMTDKTYHHLIETARLILNSGHSVILDATFIQLSYRQMAREAADAVGAHFVILHVVAPLHSLKERIAERYAKGLDPSEATLTVLDRQISTAQPLTSEEMAHLVSIDTMQKIDFAHILEGIRK